MAQERFSKFRKQLPGLVVRLALILLIIWLNYEFGMWLRDYSLTLADQGRGPLMGMALAGILVLYAILLAIPFVPGAEIGFALLITHGETAVPYVYTATLLGLCMSFVTGRALAGPRLCALLDRLGMRRTSALLDRSRKLDPEERLRRLEDSVPSWARPWVLRRRYLLLALLVNLPGNSLIGGGGGILLAAGLSGVFRPVATIATLVIAIAPLPLLVLAIGPGLIQ